MTNESDNNGGFTLSYRFNFSDKFIRLTQNAINSGKNVSNLEFFELKMLKMVKF